MFIRTKVSLAIAVLGLSAATIAHATTYNYPTKMNSAYTYDLSYDCSTSPSNSTIPAGLGIIPEYFKDEFKANASDVAPYAACKMSYDQNVPQQVIQFNKDIATAGAADPTHTGLNQLYVYGTDMEIYHDPSLISDHPNAMNGAEATLAAPKNQWVPGYYGAANLDNYMKQLQADSANKIKNINVIVDGRTDNLGVYAQFLGVYKNDLGSNTVSMANWNQSDASDAAYHVLVEGFKDHVTGKTYPGLCDSMNAVAANHPGFAVNGIQFDIEPFSLPQSDKHCIADTSAPGCGYFNFYFAVEKILKDPIAYPACKGKYFSTFVMANTLLDADGTVNPDAEALFKNSSVGYPVLSLYDLGGGTTYNSARAGFVASDNKYFDSQFQEANKDNQITKIKTLNDDGIHFQLAIPAAASAHEFEQFKVQAEGQVPANIYYKNGAGTADLDGDGNVYQPELANSDGSFVAPSGTTGLTNHQNTYVSNVLDDLSKAGVQNLANYMGIVLWSFQPTDGNHWAPRNMYTATGNPDEYSGPTIDGFLNPAVYMRLFMPNSICLEDNKGDNYTCSSSESAVMTALQAHAGATNNMFDFSG